MQNDNLENINEITVEPPTKAQEEVASSSDSSIEAKPRAKRPLTEKQKKNLEEGRKKRDELARKRLEEKAAAEEEYKKEMEKKIVRKALAIKKKQIKQERALELTDSEEEIEAEDIQAPKARAKPVKKQGPTVSISTEPKRRTIIFM